jgi:hypothetical protein
MNLNREVWEGWTVQMFIDSVSDIIKMIMEGYAITFPFLSKYELKVWLKNNQPYYKKDIPEVIGYFSKKYNLK